MTTPLYTADAFTRVPFTGNPAALCILEEEPGTSWMQRVAGEMRLSETAFVYPIEEDGADHRLRWFTPEREVDLCGHATLVAAHVLFEEGEASPHEGVTFQTNSGPLACSKDEDGRISMVFPSHPPYESSKDQERLKEALGVPVQWSGENGLDRFVVLETEADVRAVEPDFEALRDLGGRGVIVTAPAADESSVDFVTRFFAPSVGIPEDPVTGSAHCALGPYWSNRLDKDTVTGRQVSQRGGTVFTTVRDDGVEIAGHAVTVVRGEFTQDAVPPQD